ncbi:unnamed protein product [Closterium sp. NIES-53]
MTQDLRTCCSQSRGSMQSVDELRENLNTYREQLEQVSELLIEDPDNDEYKEMASGLKEVIELTEDLLSAAEGQEELPRTLCTHLIPPHSILPLSPPPPFPTRSSNSQRTCSVIELTEDLLSAAEQQTQEEPPPGGDAEAVAVAAPFIPMAFVPATSAAVSSFSSVCPFENSQRNILSRSPRAPHCTLLHHSEFQIIILLEYLLHLP